MSALSFAESQSLVHSDGTGVIVANVQEGNFATLPDSSHDFGHEDCGISIAEVIRVGTHRADLCVAGHFKALARHGYKLSILANAKICA